jgi:CDP-diacylglycerol--glycerol-3-phosphate 3-phosphatidyltransferase
MNLPNALTLSRIVFAGIIVYLLLLNSLTGNVWAAVFFVIASITDFYDGYLAKKRNLISDFGKIMDPIADKVLMLAIFCVLAHIGMVVWWMVILIALREVLITVDRLYAMRQGQVLAAEQAGKIKTVLQIVTISVILVYLILEQAPFSHQWFYQIQKTYLGWINGCMIMTLILTVLSAVPYVQHRIRNLAV